jgi:hypothetical protein
MVLTIPPEAGGVSERLRVGEIDNDKGRRPVPIVRQGSGRVVTWRRAQRVLLSAQGMDAAGIAQVAFTSEDWGRDVICNFNPAGFSSLYPNYKGRSPKFTRSSGGRSRRSPGLIRVITACRLPPAACPSWRKSWWLRDLSANRGRPAPAGHLRAGRRQAVRACQTTQDPGPALECRDSLHALERILVKSM